MPKQNIAQLGKATRFRKGVSGNPSGRPSMRPITDALRDSLLRVDPKTGKTNARKLADVIVRKALRGDIRAAVLVWERIEGKTPFPLQLSGQLDRPRTREEVILRIREILTSSAGRQAAGLEG